ncbi:MAG TPA: hypothetical protein O0X39_04450 [Methanocorpusculum sp.]|nr:hypothetical protein [Methanocorpusculum sp.]
MSEYDYNLEDAFEEYLCFSAVLSQKLQAASDAIENLADEEEAEAEYVRSVVSSVMRPVMDLMEHKINRYPWSVENCKGMVMICGDKATARRFVKNQIALYEEYYALLPVSVAREKVDEQWGKVQCGFDAVLKELE